ncbi:MAG: hypothetical protein ACYSWP_01645 [Planctomycetota bacterium]|jgi:hypothetical protein
MKFLALLKKELRECLPWIILAAVALLVIGTLCLSYSGRYYTHRYKQWPSFDRFEDGGETNWQITRHSPFFMVGPTLLITAIALGLILGIRQFWLPFFTHTWPFLFHRSLKRTTIMASKFTAAAIGLIAACGINWAFMFRYANKPDFFPFPTFARVFWEGWVMIALGYMVYLATALTGLSSARWYTTKICPLAFAAAVFIVPIVQHQVSWALAIIAVVYLFFIMQIIELLQKREF